MKNFLWNSSVGQNRLRRERGPFNVIKMTLEGKLLAIAKSDYSKTFMDSRPAWSNRVSYFFPQKIIKEIRKDGEKWMDG